MELPPGKRLIHSSGGERTLKKFVEMCKDKPIDGYLKVTLKTEKSSIEGKIVIKNSNLKAAELKSHSGISRGNKAFKDIVYHASSIDAMLELYSYSHSTSSISINQVLSKIEDRMMIEDPDLDVLSDLAEGEPKWTMRWKEKNSIDIEDRFDYLSKKGKDEEDKEEKEGKREDEKRKMKNRFEELENMKMELCSKERSIEEREENLKRIKKSVKKEKNRVDSKLKNIEKKKKEIEEIKDAVDSKGEKLDAKQRRLEQREAEIEEREKELKNKIDEVESKEKEVVEKLKELEEKEFKLSKRIEELNEGKQKN